MAEKTFREAFEESKKVAREAAAKAREAMEPGLKVVRDAAGKIRDHIGPSHVPRVDHAAHTVQSNRYIYDILETKREQANDASYDVHRRGVDGEQELIGGFDVTDRALSVRCSDKGNIGEVALIAAAWVAPAPTPSVAPPS